MPDSLEGALTQAPGLSYYLSLRKALGDQAQREQQQQQQQQFIQERTNLGQNPSAQDLINTGMRYADPNTLVHYGQASLDRREAIAQRLQQSHELAQHRIDQLQLQRDVEVRRAKSDEAKQALDDFYKRQMVDLKSHQNNVSEELKRMGLDIQQQRADTAQQLADQKTSLQDEPLVTFLNKIDATKRMIENNPESVGGRGMLGRGAEFISGMVNPGAPTPASDLQTQILDLQTTYRGLPGHAHSRLRIDASNIDKLIKGLGTFTAPDQALNSLATLRETIAKQLETRSGARSAPIQAAPLSPADRKPNTTYQTPRGPMTWTGTGWLAE